MSLEGCLAADGPVAGKIPGFRARPSQLALAQAIERAIQDHSTLVAEAGTGTGKSIAYLVPSLRAHGKVVISTGTRHLQDQIFSRDLPNVAQALNVPVKAALLKGRANYVCLHWLDRALESGQYVSPEVPVHLARIKRFSKLSMSGDKSELPDVPEDSPAWALATSRNDNCPSSNCAHFKSCFLFRARREAQEADVVVVNHHLFFADLALKEEGVAELLPTVNAVIFDEAHQLEQTASVFFSETVTSGQILDLADESLVYGRTAAPSAHQWATLRNRLVDSVMQVRQALAVDSARLPLHRVSKEFSAWQPAIDRLVEALGALLTALQGVSEASEDLGMLSERAANVLIKLRLASGLLGEEGQATQPPSVKWVEIFKNSFHLHDTPLSVAQWLQKEQSTGAERAWVFLSATLSVNGTFDHFRSTLGIPESARCERYESPFDYRRQALLYVPENLKSPNDTAHWGQLWEVVWPLIDTSQGGAFVLCTSLRAMSVWTEKLRGQLASSAWKGEVITQGEAPKDTLLKRFRASGHGVLVGSASFWEGVDVSGMALRLVVIDRVPFAPPDDPILAAKIEQQRAQGSDPFHALQVPRAALQLKQGVGRLIRSEDDYGVLVIGDPRLAESRYGATLWGSLPPFSRTRDFDAAHRWMKRVRERFTKSATTDA